MKKRATILAMFFAALVMVSNATGEIIYVDADATCANNGSSWEDAYNFLQDALAAAASGDEIRVAQSIYKPDHGGGNIPRSRTATFRLKNGVTIKGGYAGAGTPNPNARDIELYETILSGDLADNDWPNFVNYGDNSYHVVTGSGTDETAVLDGFTITSGNANPGSGQLHANQNNIILTPPPEPFNPKSWGGGIYNDSGGRPTLTNCTFTDNYADMGGGAMYNRGGSSPTLTNCIFTRNRTKYRGGGMRNEPSTKPILINCAFNENTAGWDGGGMHSYSGSTPNLINCAFIGNIAGDCGGGMSNSVANPTLTNCTFSGNVAGIIGGGMYNRHNKATVINCTFTGNSAGSSGGGIKNSQSSTTIINCILWGNTASWSSQINGYATVNYSDVQGGWFGEGNINADPLFVDDANGDYHLLPSSPCIDAGDNNSISSDFADLDGDGDTNEPTPIDLDGNPRILNYVVDMGNYESEPPRTLHVDANAPPIGDGSSWEMAFRRLQDALSVAQACDEIWVAQGIYTPGPPGPPDPPPPSPMSLGGGTQAEVTSIDRTVTFQLKNGVTIKGGYAGAGAPDPDARDFELYETILSGDLAGNDRDVNDLQDLLNDPCRSENSYHVVTGSGTDETAVLDGFTITAGNANGAYSSRNDRGSGIYNDESSPTLTHCLFTCNSGERGAGMYNGSGSPTLTNCTFSGNLATWGGGMYNYYSKPTLTNCTFSRNSASGDGGGGMYNHHSSPLIANCTFIWNSATGQWSGGGGMRNTGSSPTLTNCTFNENSAKYGGGGMYNWYKSQPALTNCFFINNSTERTGGGICNRMFSNPKLTNCTFISNSAHIGGGMFIECFSGPTVINCTFTGNSAGLGGGGIYSGYTCPPPGPPTSLPVITNCILYGNTPDELYVDDQWTLVVAYSDVLDGWPGEGNIDTDPLFVEPGYWDANGLWIEGDYHLLPGSPCIDAGDPDYVAGPNETDFDGRPRVIGGRIDMGAYESQNTRPVADAGPEKVVECACNTNEGTKVTLDGTGSYDSDGDLLTYTWTGPFIESPAQGATLTVTLEDGCPGGYVITLVVNDGTEDSEPNDVMITVVDTTPPEFALSVNPTTLWPPNHKMVKITPSWMVSDKCDAMPGVSLVSISTNESNTKGNGRTDDDVKIGDDGSIYLRAERSGAGKDRVYTITYRAVDNCENATVRSATVTVPHDRR